MGQPALALVSSRGRLQGGVDELGGARAVRLGRRGAVGPQPARAEQLLFISLQRSVQSTGELNVGEVRQAGGRLPSGGQGHGVGLFLAQTLLWTAGEGHSQLETDQA